MMCQPAAPIEARVYMSGFKFWYKNKYKILLKFWYKNMYKILQVLLCCLKSNVTCPACLVKSMIHCCDVPPACARYHKGTPMLGTHITCCTRVNLLSGVQDMHSSLCGHSLDWRNKARGLVSRRARGNCRQNAVAATGFTGLHSL